MQMVGQVKDERGGLWDEEKSHKPFLHLNVAATPFFDFLCSGLNKVYHNLENRNRVILIKSGSERII